MMVRTNVIKWDNAGPDDILWEYDEEYIRTASTLVVNDWQWAVFVRDGQILTVFEGGKHIITTANIPILTKVYEKALGYDEGAFKAKVIFISRKQFNGKWGIRTMVKVAEDYVAPVPLMSNGDYQFRIDDPALFITQMIGGLKTYSTGQVSDFLKSYINEQLSQHLARQYYMDVFSNLEKASITAKVNIEDDFKNRGVQLLNLKISAISTESEYQKNIYEFQQFRSSGGREWKQFGVMESMADAIGTSGGGAAIGTGMLLFPQMYQQLSQQQQQQAMAQMQQQGASSGNPKIMCPYCGGVNDYPYKFCKECGKPSPKEGALEAPAAKPAAAAAPGGGNEKRFRNCPYCGESLEGLPKTPRFCPYCSEKLQ